MSEVKNAEDLVIEFESKIGVKYTMLFSDTQNKWKIFMKCSDGDLVGIARFHQQSKALQFCELLKLSV